jgi:hypothetical protein
MERYPEQPTFLQGFEDYCVGTPEGVQFIDPLYGEKITSLQPPACVIRHPELGVGLDFLNAAGRDRRIHVDLLVALHGRQSDFDELAARFGDKIDNCLVGVEADWLQQPHKFIPDMVLAEHPGRRSFQEQERKWLHEHGSVVVPCEYFSQDNQGDPLVQKMTTLWDKFLEASSESGEICDPTINLAFWGCQAIRQWAILGRFGYWLAVVDAAGQLPATFRTALILGKGHEATALRLQQTLSISTELTEMSHTRLLDNPDFERYFIASKHVTMTGFATYEQLMMPFGFK